MSYSEIDFPNASPLRFIIPLTITNLLFSESVVVLGEGKHYSGFEKAMDLPFR